MAAVYFECNFIARVPVVSTMISSFFSAMISLFVFGMHRFELHGIAACSALASQRDYAAVRGVLIHVLRSWIATRITSYCLAYAAMRMTRLLPIVDDQPPAHPARHPRSDSRTPRSYPRYVTGGGCTLHGHHNSGVTLLPHIPVRGRCPRHRRHQHGGNH